MESELQKLSREIAERMTRVNEILHAKRPLDTVSTMVDCGSHNGNEPDFCVCYLGQYNPTTGKHSPHYQANDQTSFDVGAVAALERGNLA